MEIINNNVDSQVIIDKNNTWLCVAGCASLCAIGDETVIALAISLDAVS